MPLFQSAPAQSIAFLPLTLQSNIGFALSVRRGVARMFRSVEDENVTGYCLGRDKIGILGHIPSSIDLVRVVDSLDDFDTRGSVGIERSDLCEMACSAGERHAQ